MYRYEDHRNYVLTDEGQRLFLKLRDHVRELLGVSGAVRVAEAMSGAQGDSWHILACLDRMVELGELKPIANPHSSAGQDQLFIRG